MSDLDAFDHMKATAHGHFVHILKHFDVVLEILSACWVPLCQFTVVCESYVMCSMAESLRRACLSLCVEHMGEFGPGNIVDPL